MAEFITKNQLINYSKGKEEIEAIKRRSSIGKLIMSLQDKLYYETSIFLSHSHSDKDLLYHLFNIFNRFDVKIYVDWLDDNLTYPPSGKTAVKIKQKIKENRKFILVATNDAIVSKWCNWELGLGDFQKYVDNIAILPIADNSGKWKGNEYLQIYPFIDKTYKYLIQDNDFEVVYPNGKKVDFEKWLRS